MVSFALSPAVVDPRKHLSASQITVLKDLERCRYAYKVRSGWKLGGKFRRDDTVKPLVRGGLALEEYRDGRHKLVLTYAGRGALAKLSP